MAGKGLGPQEEITELLVLIPGSSSMMVIPNGKLSTTTMTGGKSRISVPRTEEIGKTSWKELIERVDNDDVALKPVFSPLSVYPFLKARWRWSLL